MRPTVVRLESADTLDDSGLAALYSAEGPVVRVNFVASVDGAVELDGFSEGLSGAPDKRIFGLLRMLCDALLVGAGTLRDEGYRPVGLSAERRSWRGAHGLDPYPTPVVVSARLDLDPATDFFAKAPVRPLVLTPEKGPAAPAGLDDVAEVVRIGDTEVDLPAALVLLRERGLAQILCEGGPRLFGSLIAADAVDELCLTVSPLLAGPGAGRIVLGAPTPPRRLTLRHALEADGALLLRYVRR
jgi:riboflavin biosynthesis pyrimidine reductase